MKYTALSIILCIAFCAQAQQPLKRSILFDDGWLFMRGDDANASASSFNDTVWSKVDLPHDWTIEDLPVQVKDSISGPFSRASVGDQFTGHTVGGTGWYRKKFSLPVVAANKKVCISFDGVYMHSDVWINGHYLGNHPYGYTPFFYDISPFLSATGENVIAVRVRNLGQNSRWYSGSGIYRHVWLTFTQPVRIAEWGLFVTTPHVSNQQATLQIQTSIQNTNHASGSYMVTAFVISPQGKKVAMVQKEVLLAGDTTITQQAIVANPQLWSTETPVLYTTQVIISKGGKGVDSLSIKTGIRSIRFSVENGFELNGKRVILKGGCLHQDNGPLGAACFDRAEERKLQILKSNGYNAIRTSHNPPSQTFLDICDSLGFLVMDELFDVWEHKKLFDDSLDYHHFFAAWWKKDLDATLLRDRNHPSIIMWSIGNEIYERADPDGERIARQLVDEVHAMDATRAATEGICWFWDHPGRHWDSTYKAFAPLDVGGYNYEWERYADDHTKYPNRIMAGTESYALDELENFTASEKLPYVIGDFLWTAMDYIGETGIGHSFYQPASEPMDKNMLRPWPWYIAWCGDIDITGFKKPQSYYRDIVWRRSAVEMLVHIPVPDGMKEKVSKWGWPQEEKSWTWPGQEGKTMQVRVFSRSPLVRLELNGKVIDEKKIPDTSITAVFEVPYQPGELKAIAVENGKEVATTIIATTGKTQQLKLTADRPVIKANRNDLSYITIELTDGRQLVMHDDKTVHFSIAGAGEIVGVGNADPTELNSFQQPVRKTFKGRCIVIVRSTGKTGKITLTANADGLTQQQIVINAK